MSFKPIGNLSSYEKNLYWHACISGSQIGRIINEPKRLLYEKWGVLAPNIPGRHLTELPEGAPKELPEELQKFFPKSLLENINITNEWTRNMLLRGKFYEDAIIKMGVKLELITQGNIDKRSFQNIEQPRFTANIDGFVGKDINNIDELIEVKFTTSADLKEVQRRYIWQIRFYLWFFNVKKGCNFLVEHITNKRLIFYINGVITPVFKKASFEIKNEFIERDIEEENWMLNKINIFLEALETKNIDLIDWSTENI